MDNRRGSRELAELEPLKTHAHLARLRAGDVWVPANGPHGDCAVGVEVKGIRELLSSMGNGRVQRQLREMQEVYWQSWLLVYGVLNPHRDERWTSKPAAYLSNFLVALTMSGIHVVRVGPAEEAAQWIVDFAKWWAKPWAKHTAMLAFDESQRPTKMESEDADQYLRARVANCLPNMGVKRARDAARYFGSVRAMINAEAEEWAGVDGIGPVIGKQIVEVVS